MNEFWRFSFKIPNLRSEHRIKKTKKLKILLEYFDGAIIFILIEKLMNREYMYLKGKKIPSSCFCNVSVEEKQVNKDRKKFKTRKIVKEIGYLHRLPLPPQITPLSKLKCKIYKIFSNSHLHPFYVRDSKCLKSRRLAIHYIQLTSRVCKRTYAACVFFFSSFCSGWIIYAKCLRIYRFPHDSR